MHRQPPAPAPAPRESVVVTVLGRFDVAVDGISTPAQGWRRRAASGLVKILALTPGHRLHRERVMDLLWPDEDPERAAARLHKAAHFARKAAGRADAVVLSGDVVALFPDDEVRVDAVLFEQLAADAIAAGDPHVAREALAWYGGELLPGDPYEDWASDRRQLLHLRWLEVLRVAGEWRRLAAADPTDEAARTELIRLQLASGDARAAAREHAHLAEVLERELGVRTTSRLGALLDELAELRRREEELLAELVGAADADCDCECAA